MLHGAVALVASGSACSLAYGLPTTLPLRAPVGKERSSRPRLRAPVRPLPVSRFGVARPDPVRVCPQAPASLGGRHSRRRACVASSAMLPAVAMRRTSRTPQRGRSPGSLSPCRRRRSSKSGVRSGLCRLPSTSGPSPSVGRAPSGLICRLPLSNPHWVQAPWLFGRVVTAVPRPTFIRSLSVPRYRAFYYFMCGGFAPIGALGSGLGRRDPPVALRPLYVRPPAPFATLGRSPAPTVRPRRARAPYGRAPLSSGAPLLRAPNFAPVGARPPLRSGRRGRLVARWITFAMLGAFMTNHCVTMFRTQPPQTSFRHEPSPHTE